MAPVNANLGVLNATGSILTDTATNASVASVQITGTFSGTITFEASSDGVNFTPVAAYPTTGGQATQTATANGQFVLPVLGYNSVRARMSSYTSGTASVSWDISSGAFNLPLTTTGAGMVDTVNASGVVTAPGAGAAVVATVTPGAGTWEITASAGLGGAASAAADAGNMSLNKAGAALMKLAVPGSGGSISPTVRATLLSTDTLGITAVGAATAGVVYSANIVAKRVA